MVEQGKIIKVNFSPQSGHEQAGYRPAVVVSNNIFNNVTRLAMVCPITNTNNKFPLHVVLDGRTITTGVVLCEHVRTLDLESRKFVVVEDLPDDILDEILEIISASIERQ